MSVWEAMTTKLSHPQNSRVQYHLLVSQIDHEESRDSHRMITLQISIPHQMCKPSGQNNRPIKLKSRLLLTLSETALLP